jgi:hypothetical protein
MPKKSIASRVPCTCVAGLLNFCVPQKIFLPRKLKEGIILVNHSSLVGGIGASVPASVNKEEAMSEERSAWQRGAMGGMVFRGADGSVYFVRDELLSAFRVEGEGLERLEAALQGTNAEVEKFEPPKSASAPAVQAAYVRGSLLRSDSRNIGVTLPEPQRLAASTIMCPWFC